MPNNMPSRINEPMTEARKDVLPPKYIEAEKVCKAEIAAATQKREDAYAQLRARKLAIDTEWTNAQSAAMNKLANVLEELGESLQTMEFDATTPMET